MSSYANFTNQNLVLNPSELRLLTLMTFLFSKINSWGIFQVQFHTIITEKWRHNLANHSARLTGSGSSHVMTPLWLLNFLQAWTSIEFSWSPILFLSLFFSRLLELRNFPERWKKKITYLHFYSWTQSNEWVIVVTKLKPTRDTRVIFPDYCLAWVGGKLGGRGGIGDRLVLPNGEVQVNLTFSAARTIVFSFSQSSTLPDLSRRTLCPFQI